MITPNARFLRRLEWNWPQPVRYAVIGSFRTLFRWEWPRRVLARINRKVKFVHKIFLMYPGSEEYRQSIIPDSMVDSCRWEPVCCGLFWQNGSVGLILGISSLEADVSNPANTDRLTGLVGVVQSLMSEFGIEQVSYSGILPGVLAARRLRRTSTELAVTVAAVELAIRELAEREFGKGRQVPLIVLGGKGFVGRRLIKALGSQLVFCIDRDGGDLWPGHLAGTPTIVVNVASAEAIAEHIDRMWPEMVILNEAYPDPSPETADRVRKRGCSLYHLSGFVGGTIPPFPLAYAGSIPCCAGVEHANAAVLIKSL